MGRSPCCDKVGLKKGQWTTEEDQKLQAYIQEHGHGSWRALPPKAGLQRCGKSCRLRWTNYLRPDIKRGEFSLREQQTIIQLHALLGNKWSAIASHLPKRTDNEIKNYWNTHLKKKLTGMGIDPTTHRAKSHALGSARSKDIANLNHMAQWETARLEAEARIVREARIISTHLSQITNKSTFAPGPPPVRPPCLDILKVWQATNRGRTVILPLHGGFAVTNQLESPTSILNFTPNGLGPMAHEGSILLDDVNYAEPSKGIMGNLSMHIMTNCFGDSSSFFEDVATTTGLADDSVFMEDNYKINQWGNILNVASSPIDSSIF